MSLEGYDYEISVLERLKEVYLAGEFSDVEFTTGSEGDEQKGNKNINSYTC